MAEVMTASGRASASLDRSGSAKSTRLKQALSYLDWLPMSPALSSVARVYLHAGLASASSMIAPAPFCCSRELYFR